MFSTPTITVIMPVYNCELYVGQAVESILNQTFTDFEFLIIDDASTDTTVEIVKSYNDQRIQLIQKPVNTGYTNSLNQGLKLANGKYIARMDGDDICLPERFTKQFAYLEAHPDTVLCATRYQFVGREPFFSFPENHEEIKIAFLNGNCICHPSVMLRKEMLDTHSIIYDRTKEPAEDYALWIQLLSIGKLYILPEILVHYRVYANQVSSKRAEEQRKIDLEVKFKLLRNLNLQLDTYEQAFLEKHFTNQETMLYSELKLFKKLQSKMRESNAVFYFESKVFNTYLTTFEATVLKKYFRNYNRYSPVLFFKYLKAKWKWDLGLESKQEFKLLLKCFVFAKTA